VPFTTASELCQSENHLSVLLPVAPPITSLTSFSIAVIAVSSPHRKEAFVACEEILEEVKKKAQIWKREYYEGEDDNKAEWKANA